ncbi:unnamed protein product [Parnassius mnemosyne]|uniref:Uncharacterized protein n=1 Tax=Parnassius mnemosyne TaxID=213953 RepID=A0AAV1L8G2_9NEOP
MESTILFNATNSIGPIFEMTYTPKDGTFHTDNDGFENASDYIIRNEPMSIIVNTGNTAVRSVTCVKSNTKIYNEATVDNITIRRLYTNAQQYFMGSIGVGIIQLLNKDGSLEDVILNIIVETTIDIECISHGTNLLMGKYSRVQPNTLFTGLAIDKYNWNNRYTVAGAPVVDAGDVVHVAIEERPPTPLEPQQPQPPPPDREQQPQPQPQPGPSRAGKRKKEEHPEAKASSSKQQKQAWYSDGEHVVINKERVIYVKAEKIPGKKIITSNMSDEEKLAIAEENERIRQAGTTIGRNRNIKKDIFNGEIFKLGYTGTRILR